MPVHEFTECYQKRACGKASIRTYQALTGLTKMPYERRFVSLSGRQDIKNPWSEINHLTADGIIQPYQYIGIDSHIQTVIANMADYNQSPHDNRPSFWVGKWHKMFDKLINKYEVIPGIVHVDTMNYALNTAVINKLLKPVFELCYPQTLVVLNVLTYSRAKGCHKLSLSDIVDSRGLIPQIGNNANWRFAGAYTYQDAGKRLTARQTPNPTDDTHLHKMLTLKYFRS
jgi:hypothetical protein